MGGGESTPFAIHNAKDVRQVSISDFDVCLLRTGTFPSVDCAAKFNDEFLDFANYEMTNGLWFPTDMATDDGYGLQCFKDVSISQEWLCRDLQYGKNLGAGFMTSLSTNIRSLHLQSGPIACAVKNNNSLTCMLHGTLVPPCDVATEGSDCVDSNREEFPDYGGGLPVSDPEDGTWYSFPNTKVYNPGQPTIFSAPSDLKRVATTSSIIVVGWDRGSSTSSLFDVAYRKKGTSDWSYWEGTRNQNGNRFSTVISNLSRNTDYEIRVRGKTWGSKTSYSSIATIKTSN